MHDLDFRERATILILHFIAHACVFVRLRLAPSNLNAGQRGGFFYVNLRPKSVLGKLICG